MSIISEISQGAKKSYHICQKNEQIFTLPCNFLHTNQHWTAPDFWQNVYLSLYDGAEKQTLTQSVTHLDQICFLALTTILEHGFLFRFALKWMAISGCFRWLFEMRRKVEARKRVCTLILPCLQPWEFYHCSFWSGCHISKTGPD